MKQINFWLKKYQNYHIYLLLFLFISVHVLLYFKLGFIYELEAVKYIDEGAYLYQKGNFSTGKYLFYLPLILLVYLSILLNFPLYIIILFQIILSAIALIYFYKMCCKLAGVETAFFSSILLVFFLPIYSWNFYLYSDSLFLSITVLFVYYITTRRQFDVTTIIKSMLFLLLVLFSRPNGVLFLIPYGVWLIYIARTKNYSAIWLAFISITFSILLLFLVNHIFKGGGDLNILIPFLEEHIICFVPNSNPDTKLDIVKTNHPLYDLGYYITHNFQHFIKLTFLKLFSFFNLSRSYYSVSHNAFLIMFSSLIYFFCLFGFFKMKELYTASLLFLVGLLISYPILISLQCNDWHNRFTLVVMPYIIMIGVIGFQSLYNKINKYNELS